jgi:hypothetical protein
MLPVDLTPRRVHHFEGTIVQRNPPRDGLSAGTMLPAGRRRVLLVTRATPRSTAATGAGRDSRRPGRCLIASSRPPCTSPCSRRPPSRRRDATGCRRACAGARESCRWPLRRRLRRGRQPRVQVPGWDRHSYGCHVDNGGVFHVRGNMLRCCGRRMDWGTRSGAGWGTCPPPTPPGSFSS